MKSTIVLILIVACCLESTTGRRKKQCSIPKKCGVKVMGLEQYKHCIDQRMKEVSFARHWYQVTDQSKPSTILFPLKNIPWLNQTIDTVKFYYAVDDFEAGYLLTFSTWLSITKTKMSPKLEAAFEKFPFASPQEFIALNKAFDGAVTALKTPHIFGNPSQYPDFTDHVTNNEWESDQAFVQRRLAGQCPFTLRKVTGKVGVGISQQQLNKVMNTKITELKFKVGEKLLTFKQIVADERLFVHYLNDMDDAKTFIPDQTPQAGKTMRPLVSTVSYYLLNSDGILEVVAIQMGSKPDSAVYTPKSERNAWQIAKSQVDLIHDQWCQSYIHLGEVHFVGTVYCLTFRRHLSEKHPLYDFFKFHCEGTVAHISMSYPVLAFPNSSADRLFTMGHKGFVQLSSKAFNDRSYGRLTYEKLIRGNGLDDDRIKYYPFRDDAKLLLKEFNIFARSITNRYYRYYGYDITRYDKELQSWADELSADGKSGPTGGLGKMPGFPPLISNRRVLEQFIVRFLWINVIHSASNYAMAPDFIAINPPKLYDAAANSKPLNYYQIFNSGKTSAIFTTARGALSNFRVNRLFDYSDKVKDPYYAELVRRAHVRLNGCYQRELTKRNLGRKAKKQLGFQFIDARWITNSVHI